MQGMLWDDLGVFLAVHRTGSLAGAARVLRVDPTTVGRRLDALVASAGSALFERTPDGLRLTDAGRKLLPRAERIDAEVLAAVNELRGADARIAGRVRITASDGVVDHVLVPRIGELRREHPELEISIVADARNLDLLRREADVAVRLGRPKGASLVARRIGQLHLSLYAAAGYLERKGTPRTLADLRAHDFIGLESEGEIMQRAWLTKTVAVERWALRVNTTAACVAACRGGLGIALLATFAGAELTPVLPRVAPPPRDVWAVTHRDVRKMARVVVVTDWLARVF